MQLPLNFSVLSLFTPGPIRSPERIANRTLTNSLPGTFAPWPFRSQAFLLPGTTVLWNFRSVEVSFPGTFALLMCI